MKKIALAITTVACFGALKVSAQTQQQLPSGVTFRVPAGWTTKVVQDAAALIPPNHSEKNELYGVAPLPGVKDLNDPQLTTLLQRRLVSDGMTAKAAGQPISFQADGGTGRVYAFDIANNGENGRSLLFVVALRDGGVACLVAAGKTEILAGRQSALAAVASSINRRAVSAKAPTEAVTQPGAGTALTRQWMQHLTDKKLVYMSSYNSGYGSGGYSSEKKLYLASDGSYALRASSSVSIYVPGATGTSAGKNGQGGRWRVIEQNGQATLELVAQDGTRELITLSMQGTKTLLDGNRWFVVGINE